jgi:hypothetical protein
MFQADVSLSRALEPLELLELLEQARFAQTLIAITACR